MTNNTTSLNITTVARPASSCNFRLFTNTEKWIQASSFFLIIFLSIIGNTIVIAIIKRNKRMHIPTNFFIVNLCVVNLVISLLNTIPDIQGRIAPNLGFAVSGKCIFCCLLLYIHQYPLTRGGERRCMGIVSYPRTQRIVTLARVEPGLLDL